VIERSFVIEALEEATRINRTNLSLNRKSDVRVIAMPPNMLTAEASAARVSAPCPITSAFVLTFTKGTLYNCSHFEQNS
jgi:hypothetical protein